MVSQIVQRRNLLAVPFQVGILGIANQQTQPFQVSAYALADSPDKPVQFGACRRLDLKEPVTGTGLGGVDTVEKEQKDFVKLDVEVNEEKSRRVDLKRGESFGFLGIEFWRVRSRAGRWMPLCRPQTKKRTALLRRLKVEFRRLRSQPVSRVIAKINPILRGWVHYFAIGNATQCFSFIRNWVEQKIRRHLAKARLRPGFGWKRWSRQWMYEALGLFADYRIRPRPTAATA